MPIKNHHWLSPYMMPESSAKTPPPSSAAFWASPALNLSTDDDEAAAGGGPSPNSDGGLPKEPLFEKPLTPSDVGKLNRLVIPKQHAERHFPLNGGGGGGEGGGGEKGLLLGFEDEAGKPWRFRYSYWNSSQSYVLTKGWSRFVKEKRLDAGDIVLFARHPKDAGRLFIGWRRRTGGGQDGGVSQPPCGGGGGGGGWSGLLYAAHTYPTHSSNSVLYQTHCPHAENHAKEKNGNSKRLRLFGVNLEWDDDESETSTPKASSQGRAHDEHYSSVSAVSYVCDSTSDT